MCTSSRGWVAMILSMGALCCFALKVQTGSTSQCVPSSVWPLEANRNGHTSGWTFFWGLSGQSHHGTLSEQSPNMQLARPIELGSPGIPLAEFFYTGCPTQLEVVVLLKELLELRLANQLEWALAQDPILHPHNHKVQDRVCQLGLMPIISGHVGNLQTIPYWVQDVQVTAVYLNRAHRAFKGSLLHGSHHHYSDLVVCVQSIKHTSGPGHPWQGICIIVSLPSSIVQLKVIIGKAGHPAMTHSIQLCHC